MRASTRPVCCFLLMASATASGAVNAEDPLESARNFVGAFLLGDAAKASRIAGADVSTWRTALEESLPGQGPFTYFRFVTCDLESKRHLFPVLIRRSSRENLFIVETDRLGRVLSFDSIVNRNWRELKALEEAVTSLEQGSDTGWPVSEQRIDHRPSFAGLGRALESWMADLERVSECFALEEKFRQQTRR